MSDVPVTADEVAKAAKALSRRGAEEEIGRLIEQRIRPLEERVKALEKNDGQPPAYLGTA